MTRLEKSIQLALQVHSGQVDLGGNQYILHPLRVLCSVENQFRTKELIDRESLLCSAVLHDVIEDSEQSTFYPSSKLKTKDGSKSKYTKELINEIAGETTLKTVESLTRGKKESWKHYILRVNEHWAPRVIKVADLDDNLERTRLKDITDKDRKREKMYREAERFLVTGSWK